MRCPVCHQPADLLESPCCEEAWTDHVVRHPSEAVAALQRGSYEEAVRLASERLAIAFGVITVGRMMLGSGPCGAPRGGGIEGARQMLVNKLRASIGRTAGATISRNEQHTLSHRATLRLSWPARLRLLWRGRVDVEAVVRTERLAGDASWACRVIE